MANKYQITRMTQNEVNVAIAWAAKEGWNPGLEDAYCFYQADPSGFFAGKLNGQIIAVGSAVNYDDQFAFFGLYIVDKHHRGKGYGLQLTQASMAYQGERNVGLDGVITMLDNYERLGYQFAHNNARYALKSPLRQTTIQPALVSLNQVPFSEIKAYDRLHFPAPRDKFLHHWISQRGHYALGFFENNHLKGYGVIRPCQVGFKIGPLFADTHAIAKDLFLALIQAAKSAPVYLDIPENNPLAIELVDELGMHKVFATARMYLKGEPLLATEEIFGITTFELG